MSTWSDVSTSSATPDVARVFVQLTNGPQLLIPVSQTATIADLHKRTIQRASKLKIQLDLENTYLQTTGNVPAAVDGEDTLREVLDLTTNATFTLCFLDDGSLQSSTSLPYTLPTLTLPVEKLDDVNNPAPTICVRLITMEDSMVPHSQLSSLDDRILSLSTDMSMNKFHEVVEAKFDSATVWGEKLRRVNLYLKQVRLVTKTNPLTFSDMKLSGSKDHPLDIFVDIDASDSTLTITHLDESTNLKSLWGFDTTRRGICTLTTSIQMIIHDIDSGKRSLNSTLKVLFELTHFPPLLIAFKDLTMTDIGNRTSPSSLRIFANAMALLCVVMAPGRLLKSSSMVLESSRQVLAWICSLKPTVSFGETEDRDLALCVQIKDKLTSATASYAALPHVFDLQIPTLLSPESTKEMTVALSQDEKQLALLLGQALHEGFSTNGDYYLDFGIAWKALRAHKTSALPQPSDFGIVLQNIASSGRLRVVSPDKLGACSANALPVITLSSGGYISLYDQEHVDCSQQFFTWNAVEKKEVMPSAAAGQMLMQKLEAIISERQKELTWELDSWTRDSQQSLNFGPPEEAIVVCIDASSSMGTHMPHGWLNSGSASGVYAPPSRLVEVKEFFKNFATRISALQLATHLGLISFSDRNNSVIKQNLTPVHLNFEEQVEGIQASGSTAIFNTLDTAKGMLCTLKKAHPKVRSRIILLTDGEDNTSTMQPEVVAADLWKHGIILDSIVIGTEQTSNLFKISAITGGYAFAPKTQDAFFQVFLLETMIDIRTRPDAVRPKVVSADKTQWTLLAPKKADMTDPYNFPPCRPHPNQNDGFFALKDAEKVILRRERNNIGPPSVRSASTRTTSTAVSSTTLGSASGISRIVLSEIKEMIKNRHDYMDVYVSEVNMGFWKVVMQGPPESAYAAGTFLLYLEIGPNFPSKPPSVRFITPILHPNITKHGRICHPILDREWDGSSRIFKVLQHIWGILMSIEARDAVDPLSALAFWTDPAQGRQQVSTYVQKFATKDRAQLHDEVVGSNDIFGSDTASVASADTVLTPSESSRPPSYRSMASTITPGSLQGFFSSRRGPPPLMTMQDGDQNQTVAGTTQAPSDTRSRRSRRRSLINILSRTSAQN